LAKRDSFPEPAGRPGTRPCSRLGAALILLLSAGTLAAQEQSAPLDAGGDAAAAADARMPEALRSPAIDFFAAGPTLQAHTLRGLRADVAGLILGSESGGDIAFEALATPLRGIDGKAHVPLFVEIDGPTFLQANPQDTARFEVYAYALGADAQVVSYLAEVFAVDVRELGEAVWQSGLKFYGHLELPPGEYRLRILVRNYHSRASALRELPLTVPAFDQLRRPFLFPVFQPPPNRDVWLPVREWQSESEYPLWIDGHAVSPAVRPVLPAGRRVEAHVMAYGLPAQLTWGRVELLRDGAAVASADLQLSPERQPVGAGELEAVAVAFDVPEVSPGAYSLRMEVNGAPSATVPVLLLEQGARDHALLWTDLRGQIGGGGGGVAKETVAAARTTGEPVPRGKQEERQVGRLAEGYRQVLAALGRNHGSEARSALLDLESGVLTDGTLETLTAAQLSVAEELSKKDVESLIPLLVLHDDLYAVYRQRSLFSLGFHAREMIELVAELYAERGGSRGSHIVAARALASLGGYLQEANLPSSSRRLYQRALAHDDHNVAALLGLATSYERYGDYPRTVEVLEDLVAAHPKSGEGQLRLAVNLERLGSGARARQLVERATEVEAPDWVRSLAFQMLARILIQIGNLDRAAEVLEQVREELPELHDSAFLLAHVYDRLRRSRASFELLESVPETRDPSPRKIYDSWPEAPLADVRHELAEAAAVRIASIAKILDGETEKP
jgi:tetratricopeptide (TPR) repeat protein